MAEAVPMIVDEQGRFHSACLHWDGFPSILWTVLSASGYPHPPLYVGQEFEETGVLQCRVNMTIPQHPFHPEWPAIEIEAIGHRLLDTWETAALKALTTFCEQHPFEITAAPAGLFPAVHENDPLWLNRVMHLELWAGLIPIETIAFLVRCLNALYRLQTFQREGLAQVVDLAQFRHMTIQLKDEQMQDLAGQVGACEATIGQLENTVADRQATIDLLEGQLHDLQLELDDALEHIDEHHAQQAEQHAPPDVDSEEEPEEVDGISGLDYEAEAPQPAQMGAHSPAHSKSSVNNLDDF